MRNWARMAALVAAALIGVSATAATAPLLTLDGANVSATWRESWLTGNVRISGSAPPGSALNASLRPSGRAGPQAAKITLNAGTDGRYSGTLKLPARLLPGAYLVRVWGASAGVQLTPVERQVTVPAPREGVVDRAFISTRKGGKPTLTVAGPRRELWAHFHFLVPPRNGQVTAEWHTPSFRWVGRVNKRYSVDFATFVRGGGTLERGRWWCYLRSGGKVIKRVRVRIT